jgi:hypothetical protein
MARQFARDERGGNAALIDECRPPRDGAVSRLPARGRPGSVGDVYRQRAHLAWLRAAGRRTLR